MNQQAKTLLATAAATVSLLLIGVILFWQFLPHTASLSEMVPASLQPFISPSPSPTPKSVQLLFGGDLMFDRNIRLKMQQFGYDYPLQNLTETFHNYDLVIANLEGPITANQSVSVGSEPGSTRNFLFTFDPQVASMLFRQNIRVVNLGNNHIRNFGTEGVASTKSFLTNAQVEFFGNTFTEQTATERTLLKDFQGLKIAFVSDNEFVDHGFETALADVRAVRSSADIVIVLPHWGIEYQTEANQVIQNQAHQFIDAGADVIIGSHPHVVQQAEIYRGKQIYYSLGNFVFDQYFSAETQRGLLVGLRIQPDKKLEFHEIPIQLKPTGQSSLLLVGNPVH